MSEEIKKEERQVGFEYELKKSNLVTASIFLPLFQRYYVTVLNVREDIRKKIEELAQKFVDGKTSEEENQKIEELSNVLSFEYEREHMRFFENFDNFMMKKLCDFMAKSVIKWNLTDKENKELPINGASVEKLPPTLFVKLFKDVVIETLFVNASDINFSTQASKD